MQRKKFISSLIPIGAALQSIAVSSSAADDILPMHIPPYLKAGDTIGITSPAGYITAEDIEPAIAKLKDWGFSVTVGNTIGKKDATFGGTDEERLLDFQQMLDNRKVKAILCARGGYGAVRIIDKINFKKFTQHPKWIIGFSDITVIHSHIHKNFGIASVHSKMCNSFPKDWTQAEPVQQQTIESIRDCITGKPMKYSIAAGTFNRKGIAEGVLCGGNLKTLETLAGSNSDINTAGKILFVEDTGEYLYSIDRMFWNLKRSGKLDKLKALIVGGFKNKPADDPADEFGKTVQDIVLEKIKQFNYPVCFDFPTGHQKNNMALKCGVKHRLTVSDNECTLKEIR